MITEIRENLDLIVVIIVALGIWHFWQKSRGKKGVGK